MPLTEALQAPKDRPVVHLSSSRNAPRIAHEVAGAWRSANEPEVRRFGSLKSVKWNGLGQASMSGARNLTFGTSVIPEAISVSAFRSIDQETGVPTGPQQTVLDCTGPSRSAADARCRLSIRRGTIGVSIPEADPKQRYLVVYARWTGIPKRGERAPIDPWITWTIVS